MASVVSIHFADVGSRAGARLLRKAPDPGSIPGLQHLDVGAAAALTPTFLPKPGLSRIGLVGFWDDDDALDRFVADHPVARQLADGWMARFHPLRCFGAWPGIDVDLTDSRRTTEDGPVAAMTLGRLRLSQAVRFLRTSAKAEAAALDASGLLWATGLAQPVSTRPLVSTVSVWDSTRALMTYAYGKADPGHPDAIGTGASKPFHHRSAFVRLQPYQVAGHLDGANPLPAGTLVLPDGAPSLDP